MAKTTFQVETRMQTPPERAFAAMTNPDEFPRWMEGLVRIERLTDGPTGVGTRFRETRRMYGQEATEEFEITTFEPNRRLSLYVDGTKGSSKKGEYHYHYDFTPDGDGTRVGMTGNVEVPGFWAAILAPIFLPIFRKACAKDLDSMKKWLESESNR